MKLAIIGSRTVGKIDFDQFITTLPDCVVSGGAKGVDTLAERWAEAKGVKTLIFKPDYDVYGRTAPLVRNRKIVEACDCLLAFWDGKSKGTKYTADYARLQGKPVQVVNLND